MVREKLTVLNYEWDGCSRCVLHEYREHGHHVVQGDLRGHHRGVLFLGSYPTKKETRTGVPMSDAPGRFLRELLELYKFRNCHFTNVLGCRCVKPMTDEEGNPLYGRSFGGGPPPLRVKDSKLEEEYAQACSARVLREIYLVDPVVIVALGPEATKFLGSKNSRGDAFTAELPGVGMRAVRSRKGDWSRVVKGVKMFPTERRQVKYLVMPTFSADYVHQHQHDTANGNPLEMFAKDIREVKLIYNKYYQEAEGLLPESHEEADSEAVLQILENLEED